MLHRIQVHIQISGRTVARMISQVVAANAVAIRLQPTQQDRTRSKGFCPMQGSLP